jgi:hypothetical protein
MSTFWDITPRSPLKIIRRFGRKCRPQLQRRKISSRKKLLTYLLMELSPSGGAANSAATQEFPSISSRKKPA